MTSFQTERLRIGFTPSHKTLIYLTGGWAQANWSLTSDLSIHGGGCPTSIGRGVSPAARTCYGGTESWPASLSTSRNGWTEGIGGEWAMTPHMTMKVEGLLYTLRPITLLGSGQPFTTSYMIGKDYYFHGNVVRLGFNWRF